MWNGKSKAVTFSFDDGNWQDKKVIEILDKYNLNKARLIFALSFSESLGAI